MRMLPVLAATRTRGQRSLLPTRHNPNQMRRLQIVSRLLPVHLSTTTKDETTEETRGVISRFLRRRTVEDAQRVEPALVVGRHW